MTTDLGVYGDPRLPAERVPPPPTARPRRSAGPRLGVVVAAVLIAEGLALAGRITLEHTAAADPATTARQLFTALARDDADTARGLVVGMGPGTTLLDLTALHSEGAVQFARVSAVSSHGDAAAVTVTYVIGGLTSTTVLRERRQRTGPLHAPRWRVVGGLPVLHVTAPAYEPTVTVAGHPVPLRDGAADVTVFPGIVAVALPAHLPAGDAAQTVAATGDRVPVALTVLPDSTVFQQLENAVSAQLLPGLLADGAQAGSSPDLSISVDEVLLEADGTTLTFTGEIVEGGPAGPSAATTTTSTRTFGGTAHYTSGRVTELALTLTPSS